ncbi:MAG TPA: hypothetical protein DC049_11075, partial [Spirochaetia bacterium]|nr:hypothetical protein [Spirochaetia bacterium]
MSAPFAELCKNLNLEFKYPDWETDYEISSRYYNRKTFFIELDKITASLQTIGCSDEIICEIRSGYNI